MQSTPSYPRVSVRPQSNAAMLVGRLTAEGMRQSFAGDAGKRMKGLLGELAASLYLFHSDVPWLEARERQGRGEQTPDLWPYEGLEVKTLTVPTHELAPVRHVVGYSRDVDTIYLRFIGEDEEDAPSFEVLGWISARAALATWSIAETRFPNGWECIPVGCLAPAETCPWRQDP